MKYLTNIWIHLVSELSSLFRRGMNKKVIEFHLKFKAIPIFKVFNDFYSFFVH